MNLAIQILSGLVLAPAVVAAGLAVVTLLSIRRAERLAPAEGTFCDIPGARIHYTDHGHGAAIVLIHGLGGQLRNFAPALVEQLARSHRVIALDRPGSGYSRLTGPFQDLHGQARIVAALIERLDLGPVVLAGHSLGGALALAVVELRPELVASLALIAPLTRQRADAPAAFRILTIQSALLRRLVGWIVVAPVGRLIGRAGRSPVFAPDPVPDDFESVGGGALLYRPGTFDTASRDIQAIPGALAAIEAGYPAIRCPVRVLFGKGDRILEPALHGAAFVSEIRGATLTLVEGGHMLPFTHPRETADWIMKLATKP